MIYSHFFLINPDNIRSDQDIISTSFSFETIRERSDPDYQIFTSTFSRMIPLLAQFPFGPNSTANRSILKILQGNTK
jgi:hypothetical protein